jgi:hypothetical protein
MSNPRGEPPPIVVETTWLCEPVAAAVSRAVRHEDACSPYLVGRRVGSVRGGIRMMRAAKAVILVAQERARRGDARAAFAMLTDMLQLARDAMRGDGVTRVVEMWAVATVGIVVIWGIQDMIENGTGTPNDAESLIDDLSRTSVVGVTWTAHLGNDYADFAIQWLLPSLKQAGWIPPGGMDPLTRQADGSPFVDVRSNPVCAMRMLILHDAMRLRLRATCTADMGPDDCAEAFERRVVDAKAACPAFRSGDPDPCQRYYRIDPCFDVDREEAVDCEFACNARWLSGLVATPHRWYYRHYHVAATRLHAAVRLHAQTTGRCPTASAMSSPEWDRFRIEPSTGRRLDLVEERPGEWVVCPAAGEEPLPKDSDPYRFICVPPGDF